MQFTDPDENTQVRLAELEALNERRIMAHQKLEIYQAQMARAFNKRGKFCPFDVGDLVLTIRRPIVINQKALEKFESKWEGTHVVTKVFPKRAYELSNYDGQMACA